MSDLNQTEKVEVWELHLLPSGTFESISNEDKDPYTLFGEFGAYTEFGFNLAFISMTIGGAEIPDDAIVMTWAELPDPTTEEE